ncbi:septal ring lytic transglycosylase RlpA family protein [Flavobacterium sp.]|uniref:septal ring lytic transglycosylase RlpA family protein n=1 Tax=Flavobacterium sp. TaxID=239 RepID=UPI00374D45E3
MKKIVLYIVFLIAISANAQQNPTSTIEEIKIEKLKPYKENVHASYYHDKFTGRKTASGIKFDNNKLTAAHKKLPFGTMLKITNKINQKSVIVKVIDRGPFINGREIDLSKKAFMDITSNKKSGGMIVKIEILEN